MIEFRVLPFNNLNNKVQSHLRKHDGNLSNLHPQTKHIAELRPSLGKPTNEQRLETLHSAERQRQSRADQLVVEARDSEQRVLDQLEQRELPDRMNELVTQLVQLCDQLTCLDELQSAAGGG